MARTYPELEAMKHKEDQESFFLSIFRSPAVLGFALSVALMAAFYGWTFLEKQIIAKQTASVDSLESLTACGKIAAKNMLQNGDLLTNADVKKISEQCKQPARTAKDQAEALGF